MNCSRHPNQGAVAQCVNCGVAICSKCAETTSVARESCGTLCIDCYCEHLRELSAYCNKDAKKRLKRIIISVICYVFGIIAVIVGASSLPSGESSALPVIIIGVLLCGFYTGLTWKKAAKESHEDYEREHGVTYKVTADGNIQRESGFFLKLIFFLIGTVLGVIITPIRVIIDIKERVSDIKSVKTFNQMISEAQNV